MSEQAGCEHGFVVPYGDGSSGVCLDCRDGSFPIRHVDEHRSLVKQVDDLRLAVRWALGHTPAEGAWFGEESEASSGRPHWWRTKLERLAKL